MSRHRNLPVLALALATAFFLHAAVAAELPAKPAPRPAKPAPVPPTLPPTSYRMEDALGGLKFSQPVAIVTTPAAPGRIFIVERTGKIQEVGLLDSEHPISRVFLDLTRPRDGALDASGECGLLGLAFHPSYAANRRLFIYYSIRIQGQLYERLSQMTLPEGVANQAVLTGELPLVTQKDPASNHNGGDLAFGPDGYLYVAVGDGGGANDQFNQARFINQGFHAAILRLDVDKKPGSLPPNPHPSIVLDDEGAAFYAVPSDNPFIGALTYHGEKTDTATVRTEFWASGLRNPWRISFDPPTGRLFAADVGQNLYEEIDIITKGGDYGWSYREGLHSFTAGPGGAKEPTDFKPIDPIFEYPHTLGLCAIGGAVYHGTAFPELQNAYIFADFSFGRIIALRESQPQWTSEILVPSEPAIAGIGVDPQSGELLFLVNFATGKIRRLARK